jgi:hypothetical protein
MVIERLPTKIGSTLYPFHDLIVELAWRTYQMTRSAAKSARFIARANRESLTDRERWPGAVETRGPLHQVGGYSQQQPAKDPSAYSGREYEGRLSRRWKQPVPSAERLPSKKLLI